MVCECRRSCEGSDAAAIMYSVGRFVQTAEHAEFLVLQTETLIEYREIDMFFFTFQNEKKNREIQFIIHIEREKILQGDFNVIYFVKHQIECTIYIFGCIFNISNLSLFRVYTLTVLFTNFLAFIFVSFTWVNDCWV